MTDTPTERAAEGTWTRLRRRKVVQWGLVYVAAAWGFLQGLEYISESFNWPQQVRQIAVLVLVIGLPVVLVLAWYHGDRGQQRITTPEFAILTLLLLLGGGAFWYYQHVSEAGRDAAATAETAQPPRSLAVSDARPSIAVLPFENRSRLEDDAYFVDGIHDDILTQLTKVGALKVIARTSVEQFRDTKLTTREIGEKLGVTKVLEGAVQRAGNRVRVTVQLIDAMTEAHMWAESYDRELTAANIFALQSEVAAAIADALKATLTPAEQARTKAVPTQNLQAFDLLLRARHLMRQRNEQALVESRKLLEQALDHDPKYAAAWSALAIVLNLLPIYASGKPEKTFESAEKAARRAMELDPAMAEPLTLLASLNEMRGDWVEADRLYEKALALDPEDPTSQFWHAIMLSRAGYLVEAERHLQRALAVDPTNGALHRWLGMQHGALGQFEPALAEVGKGEELGSAAFADLVRGLIRLAQGDRPGAVDSWNRHFQRRGIRTQAPQLVVEAVADPRGRPRALAATDDLPPDEFVFHSSVILGDADRAVRVVHDLDRGTDVMDNVIWWDLARPLRQTTEFRRLVSAVGLEQLWRARGWPDKCRSKGGDDFVCD